MLFMIAAFVAIIFEIRQFSGQEPGPLLKSCTCVTKSDLFGNICGRGEKTKTRSESGPKESELNLVVLW